MTRAEPQRRAFTVLELMLALSLASLVMAGVFSMLALMYRSQARLAESTASTVDLAGAQTVIRRAMNSLVAGVPLLDDPLAQGADDEEDALLADDEGEPSIAELIAGAFSDPSIAAELLNAAAPADVHFELYYDESAWGEIQPVLVIVTSESPVPRQRNLLQTNQQAYQEQLSLLDERQLVAQRTRESTTGPTRGAFEIARDFQDKLVFQFAWPDEPYLEPFVLVHDIEVAQWEVLIKEDPDDEFSAKIWTDVHAAYLAGDFPYAVRFTFMTTAGLYVDWIFEVAVIEPEPQR